MKCLGVTHKGIEDIAALEIKEILGTDSEIVDSGIIFETDEKGLCRAAYKCQSLRRAVLLLGTIEYQELAGLEKHNLDAGHWLKGKTFALRCDKTEELVFSSQEIERAIGGRIKDMTGAFVDLEDPQVMLYALVTGNKAFVGIDFSGFDMSKRDYNIFSVQRSLKGDVDYALVRLTGIKKGEILLDPFSASGGIPIEAALWETGKSPHFYSKDKFMFTRYDLGFDAEGFMDSLDDISKGEGKIWALETTQAFLNSGKKNAKIAGVDKAISFSRMDTDWLDIKFPKANGAAAVITKEHVPLAKELFKQFGIFLKGRAVIVSDDPKIEDAAKENGFTCIEKRDIFQGKTRLVVKVFAREGILS